MSNLLPSQDSIDEEFQIRLLLSS